MCKFLDCFYRPNNYIHSYRHDRNVYSNALQHTQSRAILNIDLKEFFPSIHIGRVKGLFKHPPFNCNELVAKTLAQICCYNSTLPQGAPTSPIPSVGIATINLPSFPAWFGASSKIFTLPPGIRYFATFQTPFLVRAV